MTKPKLLQEVVDVNRIKQFVSKGVPEAEEQRFVEVGRSKALLFFKEGSCTLKDSSDKPSSLFVSGVGKVIGLNNAWTVSFPPGLGAPSKITLNKLMSLHKH
jgi:hypothetical protein